MKNFNDLVSESLEAGTLIPANIDILSKKQLMTKIAAITNFSEEYLRKIDEATLRSILKAFIKPGRAKAIANLKKSS